MPEPEIKPLLAKPPYKNDPSKPLTGVILDPTKTGMVITDTSPGTGDGLYKTNINIYLCGTDNEALSNYFKIHS